MKFCTDETKCTCGYSIHRYEKIRNEELSIYKTQKVHSKRLNKSYTNECPCNYCIACKSIKSTFTCNTTKRVSHLNSTALVGDFVWRFICTGIFTLDHRVAFTFYNSRQFLSYTTPRPPTSYF